MFAINNEIRLTPGNSVTKVSAKERFSLALLYPLGWINQGKVYELVDFAPKDQAFFSDLLGVVIPKRIQFTCFPSHLTAVMEGNNFMAEFNFNTVKYIHIFDSIKVQETDEGLLVSEQNLETLKDVLLNSVSITVSPETKQKYSEIVIESTTALISGALANFWINLTCSSNQNS